VHDWLTGMRGGERVLEEICDLYPDAHLFTLVHVKGSVSPTIERHPIRTSWVQRLPRAGRLYRHYLPLHPLAVESFDLSGYDLVISSSHCVVKSVRKAPGATHVCYCHTPMRYAWDQFDAYFGPDQIGRTGSLAMRPAMAALARWDAATAHRPDRFLTNSQYVAGRIRRYYNRGSTVVYPPVDTDFYRPDPGGALRGSGPRDGSALVVSALVPYKRVEIAIEAARKASVRLRIAGQGPEERRLRRFAGDAPVEFLGWVPTEEIRRLYQTSSVTLLPGVEDFGIAPVEAHACGTPVVALDDGGARETVVEGTGELVGPGADAMADAITRVVNAEVDRTHIRRNAERFSRQAFRAAFAAAVEETRSGRA
jgi:glycosyltransferase involved in cell wall biosynthesis